ncbi:unnamed protein product, partial [Linum tenue]
MSPGTKELRILLRQQEGCTAGRRSRGREIHTSFPLGSSVSAEFFDEDRGPLGTRDSCFVLHNQRRRMKEYSEGMEFGSAGGLWNSPPVQS